RSRAATQFAEMDESSLLDLLECSVCLERLDTTAKVLPCQHTFCRRCLENIVSSRHELRCPECRILVDCGVDDLPANILLVRLLDGIKQRPRNGGRASLAGMPLGCAAGVAASPPGTAARDSVAGERELQVLSTLVFQNVPQLPCGKALYSYEGKEPGDLKFSKGDIIILRRKVDENWYHGELNGSHGFLPASYIQCIKPLSQTPPQGKALYDFEVKDKEQDKDCLTFTKDEILTVIRRVDDNWAEGMLGDKIGIFPILYVELNETAKQLMEMDKCASAPGPGADPGSPGSGPCSAPAAAAVSCNGDEQAAAGVQRRPDGKKNAKKRHSFTALSMTQRTALGNNRHSMEISAPVLISSSDPRAAARIGDCPHLSASAPSAQNSSFGGSANTGMAVPARVASTTAELLAAAKVQLPLNIYLALYAYKPQKADELELRKGEMYRVSEKCQDGWFKGTSLRSGASGVFPGNYVTPVSRAPFAVGQSRACLPGTSQVVKAVPGSPGSAGPSSPVLLGPASRPAPPLANPASSPQLQPAAMHLKNCLRMCSQQAASQSRPTAHPDRPTVAVAPLRPQGSPSRSPGPSVGRPLSMVASPQAHPSLQGSPLSPAAASTRPLLALSSAAVAVTPPNVSAAHLNGGEALGCSLTPVSPKEKKSSGLLKLLSGAAAKKKSRSPPSASPTHEPLPASADPSPSACVRGAAAPELHGRAGSCPIESEMQGAMGMEPLHRKSGSLDLNFVSPPVARQPCASALLAIRPEPKPLSRERYRVVVPYPPQSDAEIELKEGDIVFVHKKREDGWYKGTLQRTGRTGLFPGSFVESF
uniref:RING-type E3 ubiquitin transferase n=1 Tax=Electrophorus electricus TaxID=8005 RepID=A0AAY5EML6_ELEEL